MIAESGEKSVPPEQMSPPVCKMFVAGDVYRCAGDEGVWTVDYEGLSCVGNDVVTFTGHIHAVKYGKTLDRPVAYAMLAAGLLVKQGQMELFYGGNNAAGQ